MKITIEGAPEQVADYLGARSERAKRNVLIVENRKIIRQAYFRIRHDPSQRVLVDRLASVLGGREPQTSEIIGIANNIISELSSPHGKT